MAADAVPAGGPELRRSSPDDPGLRRVRHGRGFRYSTIRGQPLRDKAQLARIKALAIPPAWTDVWICPWPDGHLQAVGRDAAGRLQYRYHDEWRRQRDLDKHDRVLDFAARLPRVRQLVAAHLAQGGLTRDRVLAAAVRLLDLGFFRVGGEEYAEDNDTFGLATLRRDHARCSGGIVRFTYPAKAGKTVERDIVDDDVCRVVTALKRRRDSGEELLAYHDATGWHDVRSEDVNAYLKDAAGDEFSAKDFRTWHATVLAAVGFAVSGAAAGSPRSRPRAAARIIAEVADYLGNTPAVARASYIDGRVVDA